MDYNRRHNRSGHLFHGRYKSYIVDPKDSLLAVSRQIHLAPLAASSRAKPESYKGSSLSYYINGNAPDFLSMKEILSRFRNRRDRYAAFVKKGIGKDSDVVTVAQQFIGSDEFIRGVEKRIKALEKPRSQVRAAMKNRQKKLQKKDRQMALDIARKVGERYGFSSSKIIKSL